MSVLKTLSNTAFIVFFSAIGVAFADDICQVKEGKSSAIIEDQGAYSSVGTFVHELAHT